MVDQAWVNLILGYAQGFNAIAPLANQSHALKFKGSLISHLHGLDRR